MNGSWVPRDIPDLTGRRALVTGVTSGLGKAVAHALAAKGAEVVMAARNREKLTAAVADVEHDVTGANVRPLVVDLSDLGSVRLAAAEAATYGPLHLVVNNAGVMATPYHRTVDGFELQLATNHLGHFALTGLLWPRLVEGGDSGGARVVAVGSQGHRMTRTAPLGDPRLQDRRYRRWPVYAQTKLANLLFAFELDRRAREAGQPVTATAAHPGLSATGLMRAGHGIGGTSIAGRILDAAFSVLGQDPATGAQPLLMAATANVPGGSYVGPSGFAEMNGAPQIVGTTRLARDPQVARRLWEISERATGVRYP